MTFVANVDRIQLEVLAAALMPPEQINYLRFAEDHVFFEEGPCRGRYNRRLFPYFDAVLLALGPDDPCRYVTLAASAQCGKTVAATIFCLGSATLGRGSFLFCHPSEENAIRFAKMKLLPLMNSTPIVAEAFPQRTKSAQASVLYKERADGLSRILLSGANSPASLSQITVNNAVFDDVSKWQASPSGDPEIMAESRSRAIADAKIFRISTPMLAPGCRVTSAFKQGSQEMPYVGCPHCGAMQVLEWTNMLAQLDEEHPENACFSCVSCGGIIEERHRPQLLAGFEWRAENPSVVSHHRSFWIWSAYSCLQSWEQIAREYLKTRGDPSGEQTFQNDTIGRAYEVKGTGRPWEELAARAAKSTYARGTVPRGACILTLGLDCQLDRVEWVLLGHGREFRRYVVDHGVIDGHISERDTQNHIDQLMDRRWVNYCGLPMSVRLTALDSNYMTDDCLAYARRHPTTKLIAVRGSPGDLAPRLRYVARERNEQKGTLLKTVRKNFLHVGVNQFKMSLYLDLAKDDPALRGYFAFPTGLDDDFFQQLVSESRIQVKRMGTVTYQWQKPDRQRNEILDCTIYASAAAIRCGVYKKSDEGWTQLEQEQHIAAGVAPARRAPLYGHRASVITKLAGYGQEFP